MIENHTMYQLTLSENRTEKSILKQLLWHFLRRAHFNGISVLKMLISALLASS